MKSNYKKLGDYIQLVNERNTNLQVDTLLGVSIRKCFMPSIANIIGTDMTTYKIVRKTQFAYGSVTSRNGDKISVAFMDELDIAMVSQAYTVFEVKDHKELDPEYLMMWFRRPEFDRYARFKSHGSAREIFDWQEMCEVELPIPSIEKQRAIVNEYNTVVNRIQLNEQLNQKLEETAQAIYKEWFVDFEFHCLPENYKFTGAVKPQNFDSIMTYKRVGGLPVPDGKSWFVYVLLCEDGSLYKGMTNDLYRRFYEHFTGTGAKHTKLHRPVKTIHWEQFNSQEEARKKEEELKTGYGRTWLSRQIEKAGGLHLIKTGLPAPTTQLRTAGKMVWCEELEKEIPEGWLDGCLDNLSIQFSGFSFKGEDYSFEDGITVVRGENVTEQRLRWDTHKKWSLDLDARMKKCYLFENDIVIGMDGSKVGKNWSMISPYELPLLLAQRVTSVRGMNTYDSFYIYMSLSVLNFEEYVSQVQTGTSVPHISGQQIKDFPLLIPSENERIQFDRLVRPLFAKIYLNIETGKKLEELREFLLSKMTKVEEATEKEMI